MSARALRSDRAGFALAEVLVAMVILAVGLLALESLAIGASRRITMANFATEYTLLGSERMEAVLLQARTPNPAPVPTSESTTLPDGTRVDQDVTSTVLAGQGGMLFQVRITVTPSPAANQRVRIAPIVLTGRAVR